MPRAKTVVPGRDQMMVPHWKLMGAVLFVVNNAIYFILPPFVDPVLGHCGKLRRVIPNPRTPG